ncbi:hypothetical protein ATCC90586_009542 [Pythium insidiosum]|nr:hypothetical protein ATCC90586_009542 [Pythium insidiosum]
MGSTPLTMAADDKLIGWFPCSSFTFNYEVSEETNSTLLADSENLEAQCAIFKAPLCYDGTKEIAGYILDGISTSSGSDLKNFEYFSSWDPDYDEVGQLFLAQCDKNVEDCGKYFKSGGGLAATLRSVVQKLSQPSSRCGIAMRKAYSLGEGTIDAVEPDKQLRQVFGGFLASEYHRNLIPALTYRLNRCNSDDEKVIEHLVSVILEDSVSFDDDYFSSDLLYKLIVYSEFWEEPAPSEEVMLARFMNTTISSASYTEVETYCVFSKNPSAACAEYTEAATYNASSITYKKDKYWNVAAKPDASVLLLSSKLDPQTPHKYAEYLHKALDTDKKELVTFEHATHGTIWTTPLSDDPGAKVCGMELLASYVKNGGDLSKLDKSCVAAMPPINLKLDETVMYKWLSTESAFDGKFDPKYAALVQGGADSSTDSGSYKGGFITFIVLFIVATLAAVVFLFKWRRSKRHPGSVTGEGTLPR